MILRVFLIVLFVLAILVVVIPFLSNFLGFDFLGLASVGLGRLEGNSVRIMVSEDSGENWKEITVLGSKKDVVPQVIYTLEPHPLNSTIVYLGTKGAGLWRSVNSGRSWSKILDKSGVLNPEADIYRVFISQSDPSFMYAAVYQDKRGRVLKSTDAGKNFREVYFTIDGSEVFDVFINPGNPNRVIIITGNGGLFESRDGGDTWALREWLSISPVGFTVNPLNPGEMYIAASSGRIFRTLDFGKTLKELKVSEESAASAASSLKSEEDFYQQSFNPNLFRDVGVLGDFFGFDSNPIFINPTNFRDIIIGSRRGVSRSKDGGMSWEKIETIIPPGTKIDGVAVDPHDSRRLMIITGGELGITNDGGNSWKTKVIPGRPNVRELIFNPLKPEMIFVVLGK